LSGKWGVFKAFKVSKHKAQLHSTHLKVRAMAMAVVATATADVRTHRAVMAVDDEHWLVITPPAEGTKEQIYQYVGSDLAKAMMATSQDHHAHSKAWIDSLDACSRVMYFDSKSTGPLNESATLVLLQRTRITTGGNEPFQPAQVNGRAIVGTEVAVELLNC
jgi:hypothetical protein